MRRAFCSALHAQGTLQSLALHPAQRIVVMISPLSPGIDGIGVGLQADSALVDKLAYYLWFAEYAYEAGTEPNLKKVLASRGKPSAITCLHPNPCMVQLKSSVGANAHACLLHTPLV